MCFVMFLKSIKIQTFLLILTAFIVGCSKQPNDVYDETAEKEKFCSYVNVENIDKTTVLPQEIFTF